MFKQIGLLTCFLGMVLSPFLAGGNPAYAGFPNSRIVQKKAMKKSSPGYAEGEVIVKFKKGVSLSKSNTIAASLSMNMKRRFSVLSKIRGQEYLFLRAKNIKTTAQMILELRKDPNVAAVSPNYRNRIMATPNETRFSELWGMHNTGQTGGTVDADIDAHEAWDTNTGSSTVIIAGVDTGVDYTHPDLAANMWKNPNEIAGDGIDNDGNGYVDDIYGINAITDTGDPMDDQGHGTHTAGTFCGVGNNSIGVAGVSWNSMIMALKFIAENGGLDSDTLKCFEYILDQKLNHGQNIVAINASYGGAGFSATVKDAIDAIGDAGIVFCAAAGNDPNNNDVYPQYPASYNSNNIIPVTAFDHTGAYYTGYCYGATSVDLAAPGIGVLSAVSGRYIPQPGDIFFDDMESGDANWSHGGTLDTWAISEDQEVLENPDFPVPSPTHFWSDSPGVSYAGDTDSWLAVNHDIDLSGYVSQRVFLGIGSAMVIYTSDHGHVMISNDSGASWTSVFDFEGMSSYWQDDFTWVIPEEYKTANFRFRFRFKSNGFSERAGWLIDNVGVGTAAIYGYETWNGTSMSTPHVAGAIALLASEYPAETVSDRVARILSKAEPHASLAGLCVTGGRLNVNDALGDTMPFITNVSPGRGLTDGTPFTVSGSFFGAARGSVVWCDGITEYTCTVTSWSGTVIKAGAPEAPAGDYDLYVRDAGGVMSYNKWALANVPVLFFEGFEGAFPPTGWQVIDNAGTDLIWKRNDAIGVGNRTNGTGHCATADSDALDSSEKGMDTELRSLPIDLTGSYGEAKLRFQVLYYDAPWNPGDYAAVDISINGGMTWANLSHWAGSSYGPTQAEVDLTPYIGKVIVLRFVFDDGEDWSWYFDIDDVEVLAWPGSEPAISPSISAIIKLLLLGD